MAPDLSLTKIRFDLEPDDTGWPPVAAERLWAVPLGERRYRLDNIPWYVRGVACYDIVEAVTLPDDLPVVTRVLERSGHLTVRLIPSGDRSVAVLGEIIDEFTALGAAGEGDQHQGLIALDIPPTARLAALKEHLVRGEAEGRWDYEEGLVDDAWRALP